MSTDDRNENGTRRRVARAIAPTLTTNQGVAVGDDNNSLKGGLRGPTLLEDFILREKITHFDHERIPERVVHARGEGAHGYFEVTKLAEEVTRRRVPAQGRARRRRCSSASRRSPARAASADTARDVRGFAIKFYTERRHLRPRRQQHPGASSSRTRSSSPTSSTR